MDERSKDGRVKLLEDKSAEIAPTQVEEVEPTICP